ncbi:hypothetical protein [Polyangium sp. y55x31]|uniref:hypothetical protein n=1 Tax=Polyangium sp. y55x31 TaxID=3042688 RepID=UPI002482EF9E|nr:hypothetical protein [Polyangium sp. y55x31]MDI1478966.1 hypothetical protein [Polyangium sp. y55x31]
MPVRRSATRGLFVVLSGAAGCQLVGGIPDELSLGTGGGGAGGAPPAMCMRDEVPEPPMVDGVGGEGEFVVALRTIDMEKGLNDALPGLNLDGLCSCTEDKRGCESLSSSDDKGYCDDDSGHDAASYALFGALAYIMNVESMSSYLRGLTESGHWTVLVRVRGYSGERDDDLVEVGWYGSLGLSASPEWQGADAWSIRQDFLAPTPMDPYAPQFVDAAAYVTDGKLVARIPDAPFVVTDSALASIRAALSNLVLVARIEPTSAGRFHLREGRIGAKLPVPELFPTLASFRDTKGNPLCTDSPLYPATRQITCRAADVLMADTTDKDTLCEALSFGMNFEADAAMLGPVMVPPVASAGCPPATDPIADTCSNL